MQASEAYFYLLKLLESFDCTLHLYLLSTFIGIKLLARQHTLSSSLTLELHISHRVLYLSPGQRLVTFAKLFHQGWLWWLSRDCCSPHWTCACLPFRIKWDLAHILGKILYRPPILTQDFGACFI